MNHSLLLQLLETVNTNEVQHIHPDRIEQQLQAIRDRSPDRVEIEQIGSSRNG